MLWQDHWDHWMRMEHVSKGRECISPEVSRNKNIGEVGANMNKSAFKRYLATMEWSQAKAVNLGDLGYLIKPAFTAAMQSAMASAEGLDWKKFKFQALKPNHTYLVIKKTILSWFGVPMLNKPNSTEGLHLVSEACGRSYCMDVNMVVHQNVCFWQSSLRHGQYIVPGIKSA